MTARRHRADLIPNANNPRLLQRLVRLVASGIRKQRALAEVLQVELRTVHYYTQAGEWLGLLATDKEVHLTPQGVEFAFAEPRQRPKMYAKAVWGVPIVQALLSGRGDLPGTEMIASFIIEQEPTMSPRTARRRATSLKGLIEPALRHRPTQKTPQGEQLAFNFFAQSTQKTPKTFATTDVSLRAGTENNPDVYARLLTALLDHGEITTGQIRSLLDNMGGRDCPLGGYVEMATRRQDAVRQADRLVATRGAVQRREFCDDGILVALTDPAYRAYLSAMSHAEDSPVAKRERKSLNKRFREWDQRIFGESITEENVADSMDRPLVGRRLDGVPVAGSITHMPASSSAPFIEMIDVPEMMISFPSSLRTLYAGVSIVNESLQRNRNAPAGVRIPSPMDTRAQIHGGILCPGETLPRSIPDNLTLRLRLLTHCPAFSLLTSLLLLDRKENVALRILVDENGPSIHWGKQPIGTLLDGLDRFGQSQKWIVCRPLSGGLQGIHLIDTAIGLGLCARVGRRIVLDEQLFLRLQEDAEARMVYESLMPLEDRIHAWLDSASQ